MDISQFPLGRSFGRMTRLYYGALTKRLDHLDIERHFSILVFIDSSEKECTQQCISDALFIDKASMVRRIDCLAEKGYLERLTNPNDRREHYLKLTPKAKKQMPKIYNAILGLNKAATRGMSPKQVKDFYGYIKTISSNLTNEPSHKVIVNFKKAKKY
jgi:DNA-binding MarR family transcriptional regulator